MNVHAGQHGEPIGAEPGLLDLLDRLLARRWWILGSMALSTLAFTIAAFVITPVYRAATVLVPAGTDRGAEALGSALGQIGGLASMVGLDLGSKRYETEEALTIVRSRRFTEDFIRDHNLTPKLFARRWDAKSNQWKGGEAPTLAQAYKYFNEKVRSVAQDRKTGLITLKVDWTDRNEAAAWANELAQRVNEEMRLRATEQANAALGYLEKELDSTEAVATRAAISRLIEAQVKQRMLASVNREYAFRIVDQAMPPDADDPVKPQKLKMLLAGPIVGLVLAVLCVMVSGALRREARSS